MVGEYDLFISYKSQNANLAREIAQHLMQQGIRVWFNEYSVPLDIYDNDQSVQNAIDKGVDLSAFLIVLSNDSWVESTYCEREFVRFIAKSGPSKILEIRVPPEQKPHVNWPILRKASSMIYNGNTIEILKIIDKQRWFESAIAPSIEESHEKIKLGAIFLPYGIKLEAPKLRRRRLRKVLNWKSPGEHFYYEGEIASHQIYLNIFINPFKTALGDLAISDPSKADDREIYRKYRHYAQRFVDRHKMSVFGTHLVFLDIDKGSHFGLSSRYEDDSSIKKYERRYAIKLKSPDREEAGELNLTFTVDFGDEESLAAEKEFYRLSRFFDMIADSVVFAPETSILRYEAFPIIITKALLAAICVLVSWYFLHVRAENWVRALTETFSGVTLMDLYIVFQSHRIRRHTDLFGMRFGPVTRFLKSYGRIIDPIWNLIVGSLISGLGLFVFSLITLLPIVVIIIGLYQDITSPWFWGLFGATDYLFYILMAEQKSWFIRR